MKTITFENIREFLEFISQGWCNTYINTEFVGIEIFEDGLAIGDYCEEYDEDEYDEGPYVEENLSANIAVVDHNTITIYVESDGIDFELCCKIEDPFNLGIYKLKNPNFKKTPTKKGMRLVTNEKPVIFE